MLVRGVGPGSRRSASAARRRSAIAVFPGRRGLAENDNWSAGSTAEVAALRRPRARPVPSNSRGEPRRGRDLTLARAPTRRRVARDGAGTGVALVGFTRFRVAACRTPCSCRRPGAAPELTASGFGRAVPPAYLGGEAVYGSPPACSDPTTSSFSRRLRLCRARGDRSLLEKRSTNGWANATTGLSRNAPSNGTTDATERLERYDPSSRAMTGGRCWRVNGGCPTPSSTPRGRRRRSEEPPRFDAPLGDYFDFRTPRFVAETAKTVRYDVPLRRDKEWLYQTER